MTPNLRIEPQDLESCADAQGRLAVRLMQGATPAPHRWAALAGAQTPAVQALPSRGSQTARLQARSPPPQVTRVTARPSDPNTDPALSRVPCNALPAALHGL